MTAETSPAELEPLQLKTTPEIIANRLRAEILAGTLSAGDQLSEMELARQLKVSRGPIREAMQRLIQEGLLRSERNRGVFVVRLNREDVLDIYLARGAVERTAAAVVTKGSSAEALDALQVIVDRMADSEGRDWSELITHDLAFHEALVDLAGSPRLTRMFRTLVAETRLCMLRLKPFYDGSNELVAEHQAILDAIRSGNRRTVDKLVSVHMEVSADRLSSRDVEDDPGEDSRT